MLTCYVKHEKNINILSQVPLNFLKKLRILNITLNIRIVWQIVTEYFVYHIV